MYDAVFVLVEAFSKLLKKKPDQFRSYTSRRGIPSPFAPNGTSLHGGGGNSNGGSAAANNGANGSNTNGRALDCNTSKGWEHGDKISRYLRKVSAYETYTQHARSIIIFLFRCPCCCCWSSHPAAVRNVFFFLLCECGSECYGCVLCDGVLWWTAKHCEIHPTSQPSPVITEAKAAAAATTTIIRVVTISSGNKKKKKKKPLLCTSYIANFSVVVFLFSAYLLGSVAKQLEIGEEQCFYYDKRSRRSFCIYD